MSSADAPPAEAPAAAAADAPADADALFAKAAAAYEVWREVLQHAPRIGGGGG
jgi:hypothetical protein